MAAAAAPPRRSARKNGRKGAGPANWLLRVERLGSSCMSCVLNSIEPHRGVRSPLPNLGHRRYIQCLTLFEGTAAEGAGSNPCGGYPMTEDRAVLAGGCFWGMQDLIRRYPGVIATRVGYTGGEVPNATYRNHGNHAEAIEILFDPAKTDFRTLLEFFFQIHDPTTKNRQGNDRGPSYRSAIFYTSDAQRKIALDTIADVDASGLWPGKVVTELVPAGDFWQAEPEHQDYLERIPNGYTCHFVRPGWKLPRRAAVA